MLPRATAGRLLARKSATLIPARNALIVNNIRFLQSHAQEAVIQKYKEKLNKKAQEVGAKDINDLKEKLKDEIEAKKQELNKFGDSLEDLDKQLAATGGSPSNPNVIKINKPLAPTNAEELQKQKAKKQADKPPFKTLGSYIDIAKISALNAEQIGFIWRARFQANPQNVCSIIPVEVYDQLHQTARENPHFILPLKRENQGHELHFVQWNFSGKHTTHVILTTLAEYKLHGEFSKPHTTLTFHKELASDKGIVLMNGLLESDTGISLEDSQLLILNLQNFYGGLKNGETNNKLKLLRAFNRGTDDFSLEELIKESKDVDA